MVQLRQAHPHSVHVPFPCGAQGVVTVGAAARQGVRLGGGTEVLSGIRLGLEKK